jgi:NAD(P)-dependent dehydrogenase (short-subunit alcohol dehydrogenase family)
MAANTLWTKAMKTDAFDFTGRVVLVTGASRGLGQAIAMGFAKAGADIVVSSRSADACNAVVDEISAIGGRAVAAERPARID